MNQLKNIFDLDKIQTNDLLAFDEVLGNYEELNKNPGDESRLKKFLIRCLISIGGNPELAIHCEDNKVEESARYALDNHNELQNKELLAISYLRLISSPFCGWTSSHPWRPKVLSFLDNVFGKDLYKEWKIDEKLQSHEKIVQLREIVPRQEKLLETALNSLTSLDRISTIRTQLMKVIKNKTGSLLIIPLLPINWESLLGDLFDTSKKYIDQKDGLQIINYYDEAVETIKQFNEQLANFGSEYSYKLVNKFGETIRRIIEDDFRNNRAAQPTELSIQPSLKKYPFHITGHEINLDFMIHNSGPGFAYDTIIEIISEDDETIWS